jgi:hypothetical protein
MSQKTRFYIVIMLVSNVTYNPRKTNLAHRLSLALGCALLMVISSNSAGDGFHPY